MSVSAEVRQSACVHNSMGIGCTITCISYHEQGHAGAAKCVTVVWHEGTAKFPSGKAPSHVVTDVPEGHDTWWIL